MDVYQQADLCRLRLTIWMGKLLIHLIYSQQNGHLLYSHSFCEGA